MFHKWFGRRRNSQPSRPSKGLEVTNAGLYTIKVNMPKTGSEGLSLVVTPPVRPNPNASTSALTKLRDDLSEIVVHWGAQEPNRANAEQFLSQVNRKLEDAVSNGTITRADSTSLYTR